MDFVTIALTCLKITPYQQKKKKLLIQLSSKVTTIIVLWYGIIKLKNQISLANIMTI